MRTLLLLSLLGLALLALPGVADAHVGDPCSVEDPACIVQWMRSHVGTPAPHKCPLYLPP
jgi:hypothetical protein